MLLNSRRMLLVFLATIALCVGMFAACSTTPNRHAKEGLETYAFVYLTSGAKSGQGEKAERQAMFAGHMGNIKRLADEGVLVIAGPFSKPTDKAWRGVLVLAVDSIDAAIQLADSDPGVRAGEFTPVVKLMRASPVLHRTMEFERQLEKEQPSTSPPTQGGPPPNIRAYVMLTATESSGIWDKIRQSDLQNRVVWSGEFLSDDAPAGSAGVAARPKWVIVIDAKDPADVRNAIANTKGVAVDGWWSTVSLMKLKQADEK